MPKGVLSNRSMPNTVVISKDPIAIKESQSARSVPSPRSPMTARRLLTRTAVATAAPGAENQPGHATIPAESMVKAPPMSANIQQRARCVEARRESVDSDCSPHEESRSTLLPDSPSSEESSSLSVAWEDSAGVDSRPPTRGQGKFVAARPRQGAEKFLHKPSQAQFAPRPQSVPPPHLPLRNS